MSRDGECSGGTASSTPRPVRPDELAVSAPSADQGDRLIVGTVLNGRYLLRRVLGRGGMAAVWRAEDLVLHRDVAIKVFVGSTALPDTSARAVAEVRLLAGLSHPGLVAVYDAGVQGEDRSGDRFDFLVMELVDGPTLRERLDRGPMDEPDVATLGAQLVAALAYVHDRGVVHRDVKPANILLVADTGSPQAKLTDFGIARILGNDRMTLHGTTLGTANYLSPEQATGADVGPPSDIYALGLVLLECLTGVLAYDGHGVQAAAARLHRPPDFPAWLPDAWRDLLSAMTRLDPVSRPPLSAVLPALAAIASGSTETTSLESAAAPGSLAPYGSTAVMPLVPPDAPSRHRGLIAAFAIVGLVIGLGAVLAVLLGSTGSQTPGANTPTSPASAGSGPSRVAASGSSPTPTASTSRSSTARSTTPVVRATSPSGPSKKAAPPGKVKPSKHARSNGGGPGKGHRPGAGRP